MRTTLNPLGETEMEVLRHVWALRRCTVREVHAAINADRSLAYTTVMTVMKNLAKKGYLRHDKDGTAYVYRPAQPAAEVQRSLLAGFVEKVFGGSPTAFVSALADPETLTDADRARLEALVASLPDTSADSPADDA
jgi:predicted transcriptional regulator